MRIDVKVTFGESNKFLGWFGDCIKLRLNTKPEKGRANKALIEFLADQLGIPQKMVQLVSGHTSRRKMIELPDEAYEILMSLVEPSPTI